MVTLKDIANEAGVSLMTVSRVVNKQYAKVSEETIQRIQRIIEEKKYVPNSNARSLSSKSSRIIALIINGNGKELSVAYNAAMAGEVSYLIQQRGYYLMLHFVDHYEDVSTKLRAWNAEGAIFLCAFDKDIQKIIFNNQIPLVFTDSYSPLRQIINIGIDDYKGGVLAAQRFIRAGHKNFVFFSWTKSSSVVNARYKGYRDTLLEQGFSLPAANVLEYDRPFDDIAADIINKLPTPLAIFTSADSLALEMMNTLRRLGKRIPQDYSFIGFDNLSMDRFVSPPLTTIAQDIPSKAKYVVDVLFDHIKHPEMAAGSTILDVQLIERESVADISGE